MSFRVLSWRYLPLGTVTHAVMAADHVVARYGVEAWAASWWFGTGSQVEYERVASLPRCQRCTRCLALDNWRP